MRRFVFVLYNVSAKFSFFHFYCTCYTLSILSLQPLVRNQSGSYGSLML